MIRPAALILSLALAGCARPGQTYNVTIKDMAFGPTPGTVRVGDAIQWINADIFQHSATATDGSFDVVLAPKTTGRTVLRSPGRIRFYCRYHPGMTGQLAVSR